MRAVTRYTPLSTASVLVAAISLAAYSQEAPKVSVAVSSNNVYVGEVFRYQIKVENVNSAQPPDLGALTSDFTVEYGGGSQNNTQSFSITNGRTVRYEHREYLLNYRLVANSVGALEIPSVTLEIDGQRYTTQPVAIRAREPEPVDEFRLVCEYSKGECYVGEPITLTTTIFIGDRVRSLSVSLPAVTSNLFDCEALTPVQQADRQYYQIPVNGDEVIAEKDERRLNGEQYATLTFKHIVVPKEAGVLTTPNGAVSLDVPTGARRRSPLDGISIIGPREEFKQVIVPAEPVSLTVLPVPESGKPANFSGLVGEFSISASASPDSVSVGDPITLTLTVEGSPYLRHFEMPDLNRQEQLAKAFRIPEEMAPGRAEGNTKVFTQTIRALSESVTEVPPVALAYFDTKSGQYATASSNPIPISVQPSQVVTASDAEGYQPIQSTVEHVAVDAGIAHNFSGSETLRNQRFGPDEWLRTPASWMLLLLPPGLFSVIAAFRLFQLTGGLQSSARDRKQALVRLEQALTDTAADGDVHGSALDAMRSYLGAKLELNPSALTYADVREPLRRHGAGDESLAALEGLFRACEAHRYAGGAVTPSEGSEFLDQVREAFRAMDKEID